MRGSALTATVDIQPDKEANGRPLINRALSPSLDEPPDSFRLPLIHS